MFQFEGRFMRLHVGDFTDPDEPRGREVSGCLELGIPTGEFRRRSLVRPNREVDYGTWGAWFQLWRWGARIAVAGPVLGTFPPEALE